LKVPNAGKHPRYCVVSSHGKGEATLYSHGHYDVVPAESEEQFQPFLRVGTREFNTCPSMTAPYNGGSWMSDSLGESKDVFYFNTCGEVNTEKTLELCLDRARELV